MTRHPLPLPHALSAFLALSSLPAVAQAADATAPTTWNLQGEGVSTIEAHGLGLTASRTLDRHFALEASADLLVFGEPRHGRTRALDVLDLVQMGRAGYFGQHHALSVGLGPRWFVAPDTYGLVVMAHGELAYEYRRHNGISALAGFGVSAALNRSDPSGCAGGSFGVILCTEQYTPGKPSARARLAIGYSF